MASTLQYASEVDLENFLLVDIDSSFSATIDDWISAAEQEVNNYLGYTTASGILNESIVDEICESRVDGEGNLIIMPRKSPINSVSAIDIVKGSESIVLTLTDGEGNAKYVIPSYKREIIMPSDELDTTASTILSTFDDIKFQKAFTKIDYIAGYTTVPGPIKLATLLFVSDTFMRQANKEGLSSLTQGRITKRWAENKYGESNWTIDAKQKLNHYRLASNWF